MKQNVLRNFSSSKGGFIHTYCPSSEKRNACLQTNKVEPNGHQLSIQKILMVYLLFMGELKNRKCSQWHKNFAFKSTTPQNEKKTTTLWIMTMPISSNGFLPSLPPNPWRVVGFSLDTLLQQLGRGKACPKMACWFCPLLTNLLM